MSVTLFGIKNCDTMKKAFKWLEQHKIAYQFHDYKKQGIEPSLAKKFVDSIALELLINRRGTTWRKLDDATKESLTKENAVDLIQQHTSVVKRPVLEFDGQYLVGFSVEQYEKTFL